MSLACAVSVVNKERFSVNACVGSVGWVSCLGSVAVEVLGNTRAKQQRNKLLLMVNLLIRHDSSLVIILGNCRFNFWGGLFDDPISLSVV